MSRSNLIHRTHTHLHMKFNIFIFLIAISFIVFRPYYVQPQQPLVYIVLVHKIKILLMNYYLLQIRQFQFFESTVWGCFYNDMMEVICTFLVDLEFDLLIGVIVPNVMKFGGQSC